MVTFSRSDRVSICMEHSVNKNNISKDFLIALFKSLAAIGLIFCVLGISGCTSTSTASTKELPLWVTDYEQAYPSAQYIAANGTGSTAQESIVASTAALSRYFNAQVTAQSANNRVMTEDNGTVSKERSINESTSILSSTTLKALHTTDPYYVKNNGSHQEQWISVSYIKRSEAWALIEGELKQKAAAFDSPYDNALAQSDALLKVLYLAAARNAIPALQEELLYAKIISSSRALMYADEDDRMTECVSLLTKTAITCPIQVSVEGDLDSIVYSSIIGVLGDNGLSTSHEGDNSSPYRMNAVVSMASFANDAGYFFTPTITITLSTSNTVVFSYSRSCAKTGAKDASIAESRAYREIKKEIANSLFSELSARMGRNK